MKLSERIDDAYNWLEQVTGRKISRLDVKEVAQLEAEVDLWRERTSIEKGKWRICIPHNSAYKTVEGCIRCKNAQLEAALELIGDIAYDRDGYSGYAEKLGQLLDEIYEYARDPAMAARIAKGGMNK